MEQRSKHSNSPKGPSDFLAKTPRDNLKASQPFTVHLVEPRYANIFTTRFLSWQSELAGGEPFKTDFWRSPAVSLCLLTSAVPHSKPQLHSLCFSWAVIRFAVKLLCHLPFWNVVFVEDNTKYFMFIFIQHFVSQCLFWICRFIEVIE